MTIPLVLVFLFGCSSELDPTDTYADGAPVYDTGGEDAARFVHRNDVDLGAAGNYVVLAQTGITNVTGSLVRGGRVGISPAAASYITGFSLAMDPSLRFSKSPSVVGKVYASDYDPPTPASLTKAVQNMHHAYTDAAGRSNPEYLNLNSGDIGGLTLHPGLYTWGSSVTIPADVTIRGDSTAVWIFQISNDLDVSSAKRVILRGGALPEHIYWQVAGQTTVHSDAHLEGVVLSKTAITLQTSASLNGRALAQTLVALDDNRVIAP